MVCVCKVLHWNEFGNSSLLRMYLDVALVGLPCLCLVPHLERVLLAPSTELLST